MSETDGDEEHAVRAAGGVVWRETTTGPEVVVIHRPAYDDWSFPKGKLDDGEGERVGALREVEEETSLVCALGADLGYVAYSDALGRPKTVRYWRMWPFEGSVLAADNEVDDARWMPLDEARAMLSYEHDRALLERAAALPVLANGTVSLVRHAKAGSRRAWDGDDELRPLSTRGLAQAKALRKALRDSGISRVISSPATRCIQTVQPLADALDVPVNSDARLAEGEPARVALDMLRTDSAGDAIAACSHGDVIQDAVTALLDDGVPVATEIGFAKGSVWTISFNDGEPVELRYTP